MDRILLVDDDPIAHSIVKSAIKNDMLFSGCFSLNEANSLLDQNLSFSLVIIDRMLPDGDGLDLCARIRSEEFMKDIPIIFLSSKNSESDKVSGLFAGADDYMTKPFGILELKARIQARLRKKSQTLMLGNLVMDLNSHSTVIKSTAASVTIDLTRIEFKLLATLAQKPGFVFARDALIDKVWGRDRYLSDRVIDTHMSHLRRKIHGSGVRIESVRGEGYKAVLDPQFQKSA